LRLRFARGKRRDGQREQHKRRESYPSNLWSYDFHVLTQFRRSKQSQSCSLGFLRFVIHERPAQGWPSCKEDVQLKSAHSEKGSPIRLLVVVLPRESLFPWFSIPPVKRPTEVGRPFSPCKEGSKLSDLLSYVYCIVTTTKCCIYWRLPVHSIFGLVEGYSLVTLRIPCFGSRAALTWGIGIPP
jgi:hypothetical protein